MSIKQPISTMYFIQNTVKFSDLGKVAKQLIEKMTPESDISYISVTPHPQDSAEMDIKDFYVFSCGTVIIEDMNNNYSTQKGSDNICHYFEIDYNKTIKELNKSLNQEKAKKSFLKFGT
jgi:hypothetical protein